MEEIPGAPIAETPHPRAHDEQLPVVGLSASAEYYEGSRSGGKRRKWRRKRRTAIGAAVAWTGMVAVAVAVATQHKDGGKVDAAPAVHTTATESAAESARPDASPSPSASLSAHTPGASGSPSAVFDRPSAGATSSALHTPSTRPHAPHTPSTRPHAPATTPTAQPTTPQAPRVIQATAVLNPGQSWSWGKGTLAMTSDSNLVVIDEKGVTRWASHTSGSNLQMVFQGDGCMAIYDSGGNVMWSSYTNGHPGAVLVMTADGNMEIKEAGTILWQTGTGH